MANGMSRREFVERSARLAVLAGVGGSVLAACGSSGGQLVVHAIDPPRPHRPAGHAARQRRRAGQERRPAGERHAAGPQLRRLHQPGHGERRSSRPSGTKMEISTYDTEDKLLSEPAQQVAHVRPGDRRHDAEPAQGRGRRAHPAAQPGVPAELLQRAGQPAEPVLRRGVEVHGPLRRVHDRRGLPARRHRRRHVRRRRRLEAALGPDLQGLRRRDRRHARGPHARHVLPRRDRHQHRRPRDHRRRPRPTSRTW